MNHQPDKENTLKGVGGAPVTGRSRRINAFRFALLAILLLAAGLRFYRLDAQSFWNDEGNSARLSERTVALIVEGTAADIHPPLYYLLLRGWRELVGASEFGLRSLSALAGVLTVAGTAALGRRWGWRAMLAAALLTAVSPALVYYSQEARMYSLLALLAVLSTLLLLRWQARPTAVRLSLYALCLAAGLYTHYFFPAVLPVHAAIIFFAPPPLRSPAPLLSWLAAALLYLPWLPIFIRQAGGRPSAGQSLVEFLPAVAGWLAAGGTIETGTAVWGVTAAGLLALLGLARGGRAAAVAGLAVIAPVALMMAGGLVKPAFYKFLVVAVPPLALLAGAALWGRGRRSPLSLAVVVLLGVLLWTDGRSLTNLYFNPAYARADYRAMAARIQADGRSDVGVILNAPNQWEVFTYYYPDATAVYPIPRGQPDPVRIDAELSAIAARHERLYALFWAEAERDPERLVERWLDGHAFKATDEWYGDVRFVTYAVPSEPAEEMATAVDLPFGEAIILRGYTLRADELAPGEIVEVTLFWEGERPLDRRYKVFLHLVDESGTIVAQRDAEPGGGLALTTTWPPGEVVGDNHGVLVPAGTPPGVYRLRLGLYELGDPDNRLPITLPEGTADAYELAVVTIR